jgi:hypothetical protein
MDNSLKIFTLQNIVTKEIIKTSWLSLVEKHVINYAYALNGSDLRYV